MCKFLLFVFILSFLLTQLSASRIWEKKIQQLTEDFDGQNAIEDKNTESYKDYYKFIERKNALDTMKAAGSLNFEEIKWYDEKLEANYRRLYKKHIPHYYVKYGFDKEASK